MFPWALFVVAIGVAILRFITDPLGPIPGPLLYRLSKWRLALDDYRACRTHRIHQLHNRYGPVVRIGPSEVSFTSLTALRKIYGAGSGFERTRFYRMFDVYGRQNLFTFSSTAEHGRRKKMLHHAYSKAVVLGSAGEPIRVRVRQFLELINKKTEMDVYRPLFFYSLDNITHFIYGPTGATSNGHPR